MTVLPTGRPVLVLSPHLDDAVFSAFTLLESPKAEVWTVFAGQPATGVATDWDRRCGYDSGEELMHARRNEDSQALHGVSHRHLDFLERAYVSPAARSADLSLLKQEVAGWLEQHSDGVLAVPAGAGVQLEEAWYQRLRSQQKTAPIAEEAVVEPAAPEPQSAGKPAGGVSGVKGKVLGLARQALHADYLRRRRAAQRRGMLANEDHLQLRDAVLEVAVAGGVDVLLYEDLPYLWSQRGDEEATQVAQRSGRELLPVTAFIDRAAKFERVSRYQTQLAVMDPVERRLEKADGLPEAERYWLLPAAPVAVAQQPVSTEQVPLASVIIAVYNGADTLGEQLEALANQRDAIPFEVLVMDNNSTDDLTSVLARYQDKLMLRRIQASQAQGQCYARNLGVLNARSDYILVCDQDDVVSPTWVAALYRELTARPALVTGPMNLALLNSPGAREAYLEGGTDPLVRPFAVQGYLPFVFGCNLGIRRSDWLELGGMDNSYRGGDEDTEFSWRAQEAGLPLVCVDDAMVAYRLRTGTKQLFKQRRGYGRTRALTYARNNGRRPLAGMSLKWSLQQTALLPLRWVKSRRSPAARFEFASFSGSLIGNLEGQIRYRVLRKVPAPQTLNEPPFTDQP